MIKELSRSRALAAKLLLMTLKILKQAGGQMPGRDVVGEIEKRGDMDDWAKERYARTGYIRWQSILHFYTIGLLKAGFMRKQHGIWIITPEGEESIKLGEVGLLGSVDKAYREWKVQKDGQQILQSSDEMVETKTDIAKITLGEVEQKALEGLVDFLNAKNPYEFQDLVAALMRGMGYYVSSVASRGKDGGVDVVAYQDPLGTKTPRIKIQVKHRSQTPATVQEVRQLVGTFAKDGDVGLFISSGGFTADAKEFSRNSPVHVELIDLDKFVSLWQDFYQKLTDEDKNLLPLKPIYFLEPKE